jgi:hypothetical protein
MLTQEFSEAPDERPQPILAHPRQQVPEQETLAEERDSSRPRRPQHTLHAPLLPGFAQQSQQRVGEHRQQEEQVTPVIPRDHRLTVCFSPSPNRGFFRSRKVSSTVKRRP